MNDWQDQFINLGSKGLDLIHDPIDVPEDAFQRFTNVVSVYEGAITSRMGFKLSSSATGSKPPATLYKFVTLEDIAPAEWHQINDHKLLSGAALVTSSMPGGQVSVVKFRPEGISGSAYYYGGTDGNRRLYYENGWVDSPIGIAPPTHEIPYIYPIESTATVVLSSNSASQFTLSSPTSGVTAISTVSSSALSFAIEVHKPSVSEKPTAPYDVVRSLVGTADTCKLASTVLGPIDLDYGYTDSHRVEFYLWVEKPEYFREIKVLLNCNSADNAGQPGFNEQYFTHTIVVPKAETAASQVSLLTESEIATLESRMEELRNSISQYEVDNQYGSIDNQDYVMAQQELSSIVQKLSDNAKNVTALSENQWNAISIPRGDFSREGSIDTMGWNTINGFALEFIGSGDPTGDGRTDRGRVMVYQVDIGIASKLDSSMGIPYDWVYTYWNSTLSIESNPSPFQADKTQIVGRAARLSFQIPSDSQVTHIRIYRRGGMIGDFQMVDQIPVTDTYFVKISSISAVAPLKLSVDSTLSEHDSTDPRAGDWVRIRSKNWQVIPGYTAYYGNDLYPTGSVSTDDIHVNDYVYWLVYLDTKSDEEISLNPIAQFDHDQPITTLQKRTNYLLQSESFADSAWTKGAGLSVRANDANNPYSVSSADTLLSTSTVGATLLQAVTISSLSGDNVLTFSVYTKRYAGIYEMEARLDDGTDQWEKMYINSYPDERWIRNSITKTINGSNVTVGLRFFESGQGVSVWGAQLEVGSAPTPYIKTSSAPETVTDGTRKCAPLARLFGPFLGKYILGVGDEAQPGTMYWCNAYSPDYWSPLNSVEISGPGDPLINGCIFDGKAYVFSRESIFAVYPAIVGDNTFQPLPTSAKPGLWAAECLAVGPKIWYLSRLGIMETMGNDANALSQKSLVRPLFTGQECGSYHPVDWSVPEKMYLRFAEPYLYFLYQDTAGAQNILYYHTHAERWGIFTIDDSWEIGSIGIDEALVKMAIGVYGGSKSCVLELSDDQYHDDTLSISTVPSAVLSVVRTGALTQGNPLAIKAYGDAYLDVDGGGDTDISVTPYLNNDESACNTVSVHATNGRSRYIIPVEAKDISGSESDGAGRGRSLSMEMSWEAMDFAPTIYSAAFSFMQYTSEASTRPTAWDDMGVPFKKYIWGASIDIDTYGSGMGFSVIADGVAKSIVSIDGATGRRWAEVSWSMFQASKVRLVPISSNPFLMFGVQWYFNKEAPYIDKWHTYWEDLVPGGEAYLTGVMIEGDTRGVQKTISIERDGGTLVLSKEITLDGHTKVMVTCPAVKAKTVRVVSSDNVEGFLYKTTWQFEPEPPASTVWDTNYNNDGDLDDKWISGVYIECDTGGFSKPIQIWIDGELLTTSTVSRDGRGMAKVSFGPYRGVTMRMYSEGVDAKLYGYRWIYDKEPVQLTNMATNWDNLQWPYEKLIKGVSVEVDTGGEEKTLRLAINGDDTNFVGDPLVVSCTGRQIFQHAFDNILAQNVRLVPTDNNLGRLYDTKWMYDREPADITMWQTQEAEFEQATVMHLREVYVTSRSMSPISMTVYVDGIQYSYHVPPTAGQKYKHRIEMRPVKGKLWKFKFYSGEPFKLYIAECSVFVRPWTSDVSYKLYQLPFSGGE